MGNETMNTEASEGVVSTHSLNVGGECGSATITQSDLPCLLCLPSGSPGPWTQAYTCLDFGNGIGRAQLTVFDEKMESVAHIVGNNGANGDLIAAAPDMLAALKLALHDWDMGDGLFPHDEVRAAIAKATGSAS